ncbi:MAG TPA: hypothetical protein VK324_18360 [Tepidisphaeraceae bacterium]|nr:hypothetical protein [Tepidisphaeraceae bacterium]
MTEPIPLPPPRVNVRVRPATAADLPFIDALQKATTRQVGFMPTAQFEGKIRAGHVLVAEVVGGGQWSVGSEEGAAGGSTSSLTTGHCPLTTPRIPAGYLIGHDQYFKRDDVGVVYQINVAPQYRRSLVAATLLQAQFERSAWGCRLYCCWCAQDLEANRFWESMGFVPLAFRAGSVTRKVASGQWAVGREEASPSSPSTDHRPLPTSRARVHIFWQKRIRPGDVTTPWWFPSQTSGGSLREDRIVLPIPPGTHWSDAKPLILPGGGGGEPAELEGPKPKRPKPPTPPAAPPARKTRLAGVRFAPPPPPAPPAAEKPKPAKKLKPRTAPHLVAAARELRDRWLEEVNAGRYRVQAAGKYNVARAIAAADVRPMPLLPAA